MKKKDLIIIIILLLLASIFIFINKQMDKDNGKYALIYVNNKIYAKESLDQDKTFVIKQGDKVNEIHIHDGGIEIPNANCPDKICVHEGFISKPSQAIVCLPHKVQIKIVGKKQANEIELDATTNRN